MPLVAGAEPAELGAVSHIPEEAPAPPAPGALDVLAAAERTSNLAGSLYQRLNAPKSDAKAPADFDPLASIPAGYEPYAERFMDAASPEEVTWLKNRIDAERQDQQTIARAGKWGVAASMAAGLTDPVTVASMAIPGGGETRLAQAARLAAVGGGTAAAQEGLMHELTVTRTAQESALNIAGSTVMGGILGAVIRPHVPQGLANRTAQNLTRELHDPEAEAGRVLGPDQRSVLDHPLPSDLPESFYAGSEGAAPAPRSESLEEKFRGELAADTEGAKARYAALDNPQIADTKGGKILNVDVARELSPEYVADRSRSAEVHEPASEFVKGLYAEKLAQPPTSESNTVLFTAGGTGAGKTTAIETALKDVGDRAEMVYDTNMNKLASAQAKIDQALAAGRQVHIAYVYRDPMEALVHGALPRAERMGRTVPIEEHAGTHAGAFETIQKLQAKYADNPNVQFSIIDNSRGPGQAGLSSMEALAGKRYNVPVEELRNALEAEHQAGRISDATYRGTAGHTRAAEGGGGVPQEHRPGPGRQPEPERPQEPVTGPEHINPGTESTTGAAAVARPGMAGESIARGAKTIAEGMIGRVAPGLRVLTSDSLEARRLVQELATTPEALEKNRAGIATPQPVERALWKYEGTWWQGLKARADAFRIYRERMAGLGEPATSRAEFGREVAAAMRRGDEHPIPEVAQAAKDTRRIVFDPLKVRAQKLGLLPEDVKAEGADSYLTRQYDARAIRQNLPKWLDTLTEGFKAQGVDPAEARDIAHKVTRNVLGSERGTMDWHVMDEIVPRSGQMKERTLKLPDTLLEPYLTSDIDHLSHSYLRSMAPEVEMTERFGTRDMKDQLDNVRDEYARLMEQAKARGEDPAPLLKQQDNVIRDLSAIRDRLYGMYGVPKDPGAFMVRAARMLRADNALRLLGAATLAHFPDLANVIARYGMPKTFGTIGRVLSSSAALNLTRNEAKRMGAALDMTMNMVASILGDYGSHSQFAEQRAMAKITRAFTIATGETPLITAVQALTSTLAQDELLQAAEKVAAGGELPASQTTRLAAAGIDKAMLQRFAAQGEFHRTVNGLRFGMTDAWKDQEAAAAFESAVLKEAHGVTLRPGAGDTPLFMSSELGKTILQFKTFAFAANRIVVNPLLQGLARGDLNAVQGLFALAFMGTASYIAKQKAAGQPVELDKPSRLAMEVLDKSNLLGWTGEAIFPGLWQMGMKDLSRWSDRDATETLLGPTAGTVMDFYERRFPAKFTADTEDGEKGFSRSDLHFLRRLMPGQNLWYFRRGVNALEDAVADTFDLPGTSNKERAEKLAANQ